MAPLRRDNRPAGVVSGIVGLVTVSGEVQMVSSLSKDEDSG